VRCTELERLIEAIADGTIDPSAEDRAHLSSCPICSARLAEARQIEQWLSAREAPQPPATFTAAVMARIGEEKWKTERAVDIGFNLAIAAGLLVIVMGAAGLAWSMGFFTITVDTEALMRAAMTQVEGGRVISQIETTVVAALMLMIALGLWWWAEAATD
jgi:anti-sigma factor RsiW